MVLSNINIFLVTRVTELENQQVKMSNITGETILIYLVMSNEVPDKNLEGKLIDICKEANIDLKLFDKRMS